MARMESSTSVDITRTVTAELRATVQWYERVQRGICFVLRSLGATCFANQ